MIKAKDLETKNPFELKETLLGLRKDLFDIKAKQASGKIKNTRAGKHKRVEIARVLTVLKLRKF